MSISKGVSVSFRTWGGFILILLVMVSSCLFHCCGVSGSISNLKKAGLVVDDKSAAVKNAEILNALCRNSCRILLKGTLYVDFSTATSPCLINKGKSLTIEGGTIVFLSARGFSLGENSSLIAKNVCFRSVPGVKCYLFTSSSSTTLIREISFKKCRFEGNVIARIFFKPSREKIGGIDSFSIIDCQATSFEQDRQQVMGRFWIENGGYFRDCLVRGNIVKNMVGPFVYLSDRSELLKANRSCAIIENNLFEGASGVSIDGYHCATLIELMKCYYRNNTVKLFINYNSGSNATAYDNYLNCNELYYERNNILNIVSVSDNNGAKAYCEWAKSKSIYNKDHYSCRIIKNNTFKNDPSLLKKLGVGKQSDYCVSLFHYSMPFDLLQVEGNEFIYSGGTLSFPQHALHIRSVPRILIKKNVFNSESCNGSLLYCNSDEQRINSIEICNNQFLVIKTIVSLVNFSEKEGCGCDLLTIHDNTSLTGYAFSGFNVKHLTFKNNQSTDDSKAILPVYYNLSKCEYAEIDLDKKYPSYNTVSPDIFVGMKQCIINYHVDGFKNVPYVQFRIPKASHYSISLQYKHKGVLESKSLSETVSSDEKAIDDELLVNHQPIGKKARARVSNPFGVAKLGIDTNYLNDFGQEYKVIQISGRHSTWTKLDIDSDYGINLIIQVQ